MRYHRESGGTFDITVGPLMKAWGFFRGEGRLPSESELAARTASRRRGSCDARSGVAHHRVRRSGRGARSRRHRERLRRRPRRRTAQTARASPPPWSAPEAARSTGSGRRPARRHGRSRCRIRLDSRKTAFSLALKDRALSVAGSSEKSFEADGVRYSHIMDPRTGRPAQGVLSVAVLTTTGTAGDALDNAFFVLGPEQEPRLSASASRHRGHLLPAGREADGWTDRPRVARGFQRSAIAADVSGRATAVWRSPRSARSASR